MRLSILLLSAAVLAVPPQSARAAEAVDLELVLAVDVSRSMDYDEQKLQRQGYVSAFRHPEVISAIASGARGRVAVTYVEWAGPGQQQVLVPWQVIANAAEANAFADRVSAAGGGAYFGTSISGGLAYSAGLFRTSGVEGDRRAIDVSGDGPNNMGMPVAETRDLVVGQGVTINGLPIVLKPSLGNSPYGIANLDVYYEDCVIGGPGAFMITVDGIDRFETAIRRKLVLEISGLQPKVMKAAAHVRPPRVDCLIGEKSRRFRGFDFPDAK